jgi:hypothetical protein
MSLISDLTAAGAKHQTFCMIIFYTLTTLTDVINLVLIFQIRVLLCHRFFIMHIGLLRPLPDVTRE